MNIFVKSLDGLVIEMRVVPDHNTVGFVKSSIEQLRGISLNEQWLTLPGLLLNDQLLLSQYDIKPETILNLIYCRPRSLLLFVKTVSGKIITLDVQPSDSVEKVKKQIERDEGIPFHHQRLVYSGKKLENGRHVFKTELENDLTVSDYHIPNGATLCLLMRIIVKTVRGKTICLEVNPSDLIKDIKSRITDTEGDLLDNLRLVLVGKEREDGSYLFKVPLEDDDATLADYNVTDSSTMSLIPILRLPEHTHIFVKTFAGKTLTMKVSPSDTVERIRSLIQDTEGISASQMRLRFIGKPMANGDPLFKVDLNDRCTLSDYGIQDGSTIQLVMQVSVKTFAGKIIFLGVKPSDTIQDVKAKILQAEGIPPEHQHLKFTAKRQQGGQALFDVTLEDDLATLIDYNITDGSVITLVMLVFIKQRNGNTITLEVTPSTTIGNVKEMLIQKTGVPSDTQRLLFLESKLFTGSYLVRISLDNSAATLSQYCIRDKSTIYLDTLKRVTISAYTKGSHVRTTFTVEVHPLLTIPNLLNQIYRHQKGDIRQGSFLPTTSEGIKMDNTSWTLFDYNISDDSTIYFKKSVS